MRRHLAADLVLSEFMASNDHLITDSVGDHSDWIEVHNAGDADANLADYYLTNDSNTPLKWHFPAQTLAAGGYLVVFADSQNLAVAGKELHTNFNLSAAGDYLALTNAADGSAHVGCQLRNPHQRPARGGPPRRLGRQHRLDRRSF